MLAKKGDEHYMFLCACLISSLVNATVEIIIEMNIVIDVSYRQRSFLPSRNLCRKSKYIVSFNIKLFLYIMNQSLLLPYF